MKVKYTLTAKKIYTQDYPDDDFSDEILISNFWCHVYDDDEFQDVMKLKVERSYEK
jgi:hypothetical protein